MFCPRLGDMGRSNSHRVDPLWPACSTPNRPLAAMALQKQYDAAFQLLEVALNSDRAGAGSEAIQRLEVSV